MSDFITQTLEYWVSGGVLLIPIGLVSFGIWFYFLKTRWVLISSLSESAGLEEDLSSGRPPARLLEQVRSMPGVIARVVQEALEDILRGIKPAEAYESRTSGTIKHLKRNFVILGALTAMAPLLGLLGTVMGMIQTFQAVAGTAGETAVNVAAGISKALITTQFGLIVAIPGVFGLTFLGRLMRQVNVRFAAIRAHLLLHVTGTA